MELGEKSHTPKDLLNKFGVLCVLLPYYGYYEEWKFLLCLTSKKSREHWCKYKDAYWNEYQHGDDFVLWYNQEFNPLFEAFLLSPEFNTNHKVQVYLEDNQDFVIFYKFLRKVMDWKAKIRFYQIKMKGLPADYNLINKIYDWLHNLGVQDCIIDFPDYCLHQTTLPEEFKFNNFGTISRPEYLFNALSVDWLELTPNMLKELTNTELNVRWRNINLSIPNIAENKESLKGISDSIRNSCSNVKFDTYTKDQESLIKTIEIVKEIFPNLSGVSIHTSTYSEQELCEVLSHIQVKNITYNGNSLQAYNNRIIQKSPIFYLKAKGETEFKAFFSERLLVYFHDHSGVKHTAHDFVVLNSLTVFKGANCRRVNFDEFYQRKLNEYLKQAGISSEGKNHYLTFSIDTKDEFIMILDAVYNYAHAIQVFQTEEEQIELTRSKFMNSNICQLSLPNSDYINYTSGYSKGEWNGDFTKLLQFVKLHTLKI